MSSDETTTATTTAIPDLAKALRELGLHATAAGFSDFVAQVTKLRLAPVQILEELARRELLDRARRSLERRHQRARIGRFKAVADFDWGWPKRIDRKAVESALALDFLREGGNLILVGPQGVGKTMLAKNIALLAVLGGHSVLFLSAAQMLLDLSAQESARALERRLRHYATPALLCLDELGYLAYDNHAADLLFQVIARRYERRSVLVTTNLSFADWPTIFPNATCVTALVDRLTHHADIILIEGQSYRRREAEEQRKRRNAGVAP